MENKENIDNNNYDSKKKLEQLKNDIYKSIAKEFNISQDTAEKLATLKTDTGFESYQTLKKQVELNSNLDSSDKKNILSLTSTRLDNLYNAISGAIKISNKEYIENIEVVVLGDKAGLSKKLFPKLYEKSINPEKGSDQIIGFCLGGFDTCSTTIKFLIDIGAGVIKTPNHTYMILSGKGQYRNIEKKYFILGFLITFLIIGVYLYYFFN